MNDEEIACQEVNITGFPSPTPIFKPSDFTPLTLPNRKRPAPTPLLRRTVFESGIDWQSKPATTVLDALRNSLGEQAEAQNTPSSALSFRRSAAAVEVDSSAADLFTPLIHPFPRQIRLIQCNACRRPLLITRFFQHLPNCPSRNRSSSSPQLTSRDDPNIHLIAAPYLSPPSSPPPRKRPRLLPAPLSLQSPPSPTKSAHQSDRLLQCEDDHKFCFPREEDNWRSRLTPLTPPYKYIPKYKRRRILLPAPQESSSQRKRTLAVEKKVLAAAADASIHPIPARSPTHHHQANARDPLRNAITCDSTNMPWSKLVQIALPLSLPRNPNPRNLNKDSGPTQPPFNATPHTFPNSPPVTPTARAAASAALEARDGNGFIPFSPTPSLAGSLLYLRGQGSRALANTPLSMLDVPQQPMHRIGPVFHGQPSVAPPGAFLTDPRPSGSLATFTLPTITSVMASDTPAPESAPAAWRPPPSDPRTKKMAVNAGTSVNAPPNPMLLNNINAANVPAAANTDTPALSNVVTPAVAVNPVNPGGHAINGNMKTIPAPNGNMPGAVNSNMPGAIPASAPLNPGRQAISNAMPVSIPMTPADVRFTPHVPYGTPNRPPPSPSVGKRQRGSKQRSQAMSVGTGAGTGPQGRVNVGSKKSNANRTTVGMAAAHAKAASSVLNAQQRLQSPVGSITRTPPSDTLSEVALGSSVATAAPANYNARVLQQEKNAFRSPGRMGVAPNVSHAITGQELAGVVGVSNPTHAMGSKTARGSGKGRGHTNAAAISRAMRTASGGKSVKNQSPSQGSMHSADRSSLHGAGAGSPGYDAMMLTAPFSQGEMAGKRMPAGRVEGGKQTMDFHPAIFAQVGSHTVNAALREESLSEVRAAMGNVSGKGPSFAGDGGVGQLPRQDMRGLSGGGRMNENEVLNAAGVRVSAGMKGPGGRGSGQLSESRGNDVVDEKTGSSLEAQLRFADILHVDGTGLKEKVSGKSMDNSMGNAVGSGVDYAARIDQTMLAAQNAASQGYYNAGFGGAGSTGMDVSGNAGLMKNQAPNLALLGLGHSGQTQAGQKAQQQAAANAVAGGGAGGNNVVGGVAGNVMQGVHDVRNVTAFNGLQMLSPMGMQASNGQGRHNANIMNMVQASRMSGNAAMGQTGLQNGSNTSIVGGGGAGVAGNNAANVVSGGIASGRNNAMPADAMLQQIMSGRSSMSGSNLSNGAGNAVGVGGMGLNGGVAGAGGVRNIGSGAMNVSNGNPLNNVSAGLTGPPHLGVGGVHQGARMIKFDESDLVDL